MCIIGACTSTRALKQVLNDYAVTSITEQSWQHMGHFGCYCAVARSHCTLGCCYCAVSLALWFMPNDAMSLPKNYIAIACRYGNIESPVDVPSKEQNA